MHVVLKTRHVALISTYVDIRATCVVQTYLSLVHSFYPYAEQQPNIGPHADQYRLIPLTYIGSPADQYRSLFHSYDDPASPPVLNRGEMPRTAVYQTAYRIIR